VKARVLGLGNVLLGDDALGPTVAHRLAAGWSFPEGVEVLDLGTPGLDLIPYVTGVDVVVLVDTVKAAAPPGSLRVYGREDILRHPPGPRLSPHDPGVKEALLTAALMGEAPREVRLVGVVPERVDTGIGLSPALRAALPVVEAAVVAELQRLGLTPQPVVVPADPQLWWEAAP
jgi:hydrogenase maturation protease